MILTFPHKLGDYYYILIVWTKIAWIQVITVREIWKNPVIKG